MSKFISSDFDKEDMRDILANYRDDWLPVKSALKQLITGDFELYLRLSMVNDEYCADDPYLEYSYYVDLNEGDNVQQSQLISRLQECAQSYVIFTNLTEYTALEQIDKRYRVYLVEVFPEYIYIHRRISFLTNLNKYSKQSYLSYFEEAFGDGVGELYLKNFNFSLLDLHLREVTLWYKVGKFSMTLKDYVNCTAIIEDKRGEHDMNYVTRYLSKKTSPNSNYDSSELRKRYSESFTSLRSYCIDNSKCLDISAQTEEGRKLTSIRWIYYSQSDERRLLLGSPRILAWKYVMHISPSNVVKDILAAKEIFKKDNVKDLTLDEISLVSGRTVEEFLEKCDDFDLILLDCVTGDARLMNHSFDLPYLWPDSLLDGLGLVRKVDNRYPCKVCLKPTYTYSKLSYGISPYRRIYIHNLKCLRKWKDESNVKDFR